MSRARPIALTALLLLLAALSLTADAIDDTITDLNGVDARKQLHAVMALRRFRDPRITKTVISRLADTNTPLSVRIACVTLVNEQKLTEALDTLLAITNDAQQPPAIRQPAMTSLVFLTASKHADLFIKLLREDKSAIIRKHAANCLGYTQDPKLTPRLLLLLDDPDAAVYAVQAIGVSGDKTAADALLAKLNTQDPTLKIALIRTLGELAHKPAVDPLLQLLKEDNHDQKVVILNALGRIGDPRIIPHLDLTRRIQNHPRSIRTRALLSLAHLKATTALPTVTAIAKAPGENIQIRMDAVRTLGSFGDDAIPILLELLDDKGLTRTAALALNQITGGFLGTDRARWAQFCEDYLNRKRPQPPRR